MKQIEFGDFQTPVLLAQNCLGKISGKPDIVIEPTCGVGAFLLASKQKWPGAQKIGVELNSEYLAQTKKLLKDKTKLVNEDIFKFDWATLFSDLKGKVLFIGNPPWVTNSTQGQIKGANLPSKQNSEKLSGLEAMTGKSNFDISESILLKILTQAYEYLPEAEFAFLIKTSVARKIFVHVNKMKLGCKFARIYKIDAKKSFNVSVDACLFYFKAGKKFPLLETCEVFGSLEDKMPLAKLGYTDGKLVADLDLYRQSKNLFAENFARWRSGVKHDCSSIVEFKQDHQGNFFNNNGDKVEIEASLVFPLLKSSDISKDKPPRKWLLLTQTKPGEDTAWIKKSYPKTWKYLEKNKVFFERRKSSIYKQSPRYAMFGIGPYSYGPWKVAISGLMKDLQFRLIGPIENQPVMLDDTCYFLSFENKKQAQRCLKVLQSEAYMKALKALIFMDSKRPVTAELLNSIAIQRIDRFFN